LVVTAYEEMGSEQRMLIDGQLVDGSDGTTFDNVNPTTEAVIGPVADGSTADMYRAVGAARRAFDGTTWSTDHAFRKHCLEQLQTALRAETELFRRELVAEVGCPVKTHGSQVDGPLADAFSFPLRMIDEFEWESNLIDDPALGRCVVVKEPVGVVGAIVPWNFPLEITLTKLAPILAGGNTVVLKPAPDTPYNATRLGRLITEQTDIPPGVVNIVTSLDHAVGEALVADPRVDLVSFTGSTATGRRIMVTASGTIKRLFLELGGKSAHVVLDDADFEAVLPSAAMVCVHGGQGCALPTRFLVPRDRHDDAVDVLRQVFANVPYGDPNDPNNLMGPLISSRQRDRVLGYIETGVSEGGDLVVGGGRPSHLDRGYFVEPTLFVGVDNKATIAQEEIFGPVLCLIPYDGDADAVRIANDSVYGLMAIVSGGDPERAAAVGRQIRAGSVAAGRAFYRSDVPFGGYKQSGFGRQNGIEGFNQYLETKTLGLPPI
jgi:aldehyde dehydrogenase (NAD+)